MSNMRKKAAGVVAECDRLDAALRDGQGLKETRDLLHGLIDFSGAGKLRLFLTVVKVAAEATLRRTEGKVP